MQCGAILEESIRVVKHWTILPGTGSTMPCGAILEEEGQEEHQGGYILNHFIRYRATHGRQCMPCVAILREDLEQHQGGYTWNHFFQYRVTHGKHWHTEPFLPDTGSSMADITFSYLYYKWNQIILKIIWDSALHETALGYIGYSKDLPKKQKKNNNFLCFQQIAYPTDESCKY